MRTLIAFIFAVIAGACLPAFAEPRVALVIGNAKYQAGALPPLTNPVNDAQLMNDTLRAVGFDVVLVTDGTEDQMEKAIREFGQRLKAAGPEAVGLFYYSGHGVQSDGNNYMVPVDAEVQTIEDVESEAPRMGLVIRQMDLAGNAANFIILDACRNNTLPSETRNAERGLTPIAARSSTNLFIAYATQPGAVAADGSGLNSPYTQALARLMRSEAAPAVNMFLRVGAAVREATGNRQQPWTENGLANDAFCFKDCNAAAPNCAQAPPPAQVFFRPDQADLTDDNISAISALVKRVLESGCEVRAIAINSYSDGSTQRDAALQLAQRRGDVVQAALAGLGLPANLMKVTPTAVVDTLDDGRRIQVVQRVSEIWVSYKSDGPALLDTLQAITTRGMILNTSVARLDLKFFPDGTFTTQQGRQGKWRADVSSLCLTLDTLLDNACEAYPAGKTSGDQFELPSGNRVVVK